MSNLDLKKKVEKKLETLEKRTQESILSMVREKLKQEDENSNSNNNNVESKHSQSGVALWKAVHSFDSEDMEQDERWN